MNNPIPISIRSRDTLEQWGFNLQGIALAQSRSGYLSFRLRNKHDGDLVGLFEVKAHGAVRVIEHREIQQKQDAQRNSFSSVNLAGTEERRRNLSRQFPRPATPVADTQAGSSTQSASQPSDYQQMLTSARWCCSQCIAASAEKAKRHRSLKFWKH